MASKILPKIRIQNKIDTTAHWDAAVNFKPLLGEIIIYQDTDANGNITFVGMKIGDWDGVSANQGHTVGQLPFITATPIPNADIEALFETFSQTVTFTPSGDQSRAINTYAPISVSDDGETWTLLEDFNDGFDGSIWTSATYTFTNRYMRFNLDNGGVIPSITCSPDNTQSQSGIYSGSTDAIDLTNVTSISIDIEV